MTLHHLSCEQILPVSPAGAWGFFSSPLNLGAISHGLFVRRKLERVFAFRRQVLAERFGAL